MSTRLISSHAPTGTDDEAGARLAALRVRIASLRVQSQAVQAAGTSTPAMGDLPLVPVFDPAIRPAEGLSADRDVTKRDERILTVLRERGALRVLGAVASADLAQSISQLHGTHPNFSEAIDHVLGEEILARQRSGALCGLRLLIHGTAGVGKTDFALSLAKLLALPGEVISLSAAQASAFLAGSEQYWSNSQPGLVWKALIQGTHANPLFVLDEIDKVPNNWGDPLGALYQLLEPRSASIFCDKSVPWLPINASYASWIATANDPSPLHPAIRSRFTEIEVTAPPEARLHEIAQRLYADLLTEFELVGRFPAELTQQQTQVLLSSSIRDAKRLLRTALARALRQGQHQITLITPSAGSSQRIGFV